MAKYTSFEDVRRLYQPIDTAELTSQDQEFYMIMAESVIDGCVSTRYDLPFTTVPTLIRYIATELALIYMLDSFFTQEARSENSWVDKRRDFILGEKNGILTKIKNGEINLTDENGDELTEDSNKFGFSSDTSQYTPTFGHGFVGNEEIDPDRLEAEEDARD